MRINTRGGFTIVELLIVIVVIAVLATITIVTFNGIQDRATKSAMTSELAVAGRVLQNDYTLSGLYPAMVAAANEGKGLEFNAAYTILYIPTSSSYCLSLTKGSISMQMVPVGTITNGACSVMTGATATSPLIVDGNTSSTSFYDGSSGLRSVTVDLGAVKPVSGVTIGHYYADGRTYNNPKTEVSTDGTTWTTVYDGAVSGTYQETSAGKTITFTTQSVRYIRDTTNGSSANPSNHWVEIKAF